VVLPIIAELTAQRKRKAAGRNDPNIVCTYGYNKKRKEKKAHCTCVWKYQNPFVQLVYANKDCFRQIKKKKKKSSSSGRKEAALTAR
jgi:hypothetical protein